MLRGALPFSSDRLVGNSRSESVVMNIVPFDLNPPRCSSFCNGAAGPCETRLRYRRGYVAVRHVDKVDMKKICRKVQKSFPHFKLTDGVAESPAARHSGHPRSAIFPFDATSSKSSQVSRSTLRRLPFFPVHGITLSDVAAYEASGTWEYSRV